MTSSPSSSPPLRWTPTRRAALDRLQEFLPRAGRSYATERNTDFGPGRRDNVSNLSPYLRRRLITEEEVVAAVLDRHTATAAEKFIQEVYWRTYWKGWLEMRPQVWDHYLADLSAARRRLDEDSDLASRLQAAEAGSTGIDCLDTWVAELVEFGYLHNHTRMWVASIWTFTLRLPWVLGADFFFRHLLDADPASNTLSWRWVAGLHTKGKFYAARAENIRRFTDGRFDPTGQLDEDPDPVTDSRSYELQPLHVFPSADPGRRTGLLLTEDDLRGDVPEGLEIAAAACLAPARGRRSDRCLEFSRRAMVDTCSRLRDDGIQSVCPEPLDPEEVRVWAEDQGLEQIVVFDPGVGETDPILAELGRQLDEVDARLARARRPWDQRLFPHARAGFFRFRKRIPDDLERIRTLRTTDALTD